MDDRLLQTNGEDATGMAGSIYVVTLGALSKQHLKSETTFSIEIFWNTPNLIDSIV